MTHFENKSSDQRGALMVEAIALLGLMTMMSPMVVRQSSERIQEMEDVTVAAQMKTMKDALANYMEANYASLVGNNNQESTKTAAVSATDLRPFLPASYFDGSNNLHGNKTLAGDQFKFGVRMTCSESTLLANGNQCGTLENGVRTGLTGSCKCERYKLTGLVIGGSSIPVPEKRASRIASMIGADGGYMRTAAMNEVLGEGDAGKVKVLGSQGMWEITNTGDYAINFTEEEQSVGGRIAASTVYSAGRSADYLYRKKVNGIPDANSMFTDLDMGGNGACDAEAGDGKCNRINNAGGVEIIAGHLVIRKKNLANNDDEGSGDQRARVYVDTETAKINMSKQVILSAGKADAGLPSGEDGSIQIMANKNVATEAVEAISSKAPKVTLENDSKNIITLESETMTLHTGEDSDDSSSNIELTKEQLLEKGQKIAITSTVGEIAMNANTEVSTTAGTDITMTATAGKIAGTAHTDVTFNADNDSKIHAGRTAQMDAGNDYLITLSSSSHDDVDKGILIQNNDADSDITVDASGNVVAMADKKMYLGAGGDTLKSQLILNAAATRMDDRTAASGDKKYGTLAQMKGGLFVISDTSSETTGGLQIGTSAAEGTGVSRVYLTSNGMTVHRSTNDQPGAYVNASVLTSVAAANQNQYDNRGNKYTTAVGKEDVVVTASDTNGGFIALNAKGAGTATAGTPSITLSGKTGVINASRMEVTTVRDPSNDTQKNAIRSTTNVSYSALGVKDGGETTAADAKHFTLKRGSSSAITYETHGENDLTNLSYAVDPAFLSTMNDIRLTSRGGARLSEILPNYITKGIYELRNTYVKGPWPCSGSTGCSDGNTMCANCSHTLPKNIVNSEGSIAAGYGFEGFLNCDVIDPNASGHSTCSESENTITINLQSTNYLEGEGMAHPFMGVVPAPGRQVSTGSGTPKLEASASAETMAAYDEGSCPNGYTALMSVTPASFSIGGVWGSYADESDAAGWMASFGDAAAVVNSEQVIQGGNIMGVTNLAIKNDAGKTVGWAIAMSTVAAGGDGDAVYYWNYAGTVYTNTITAYVTTYCYYNPSFFNLPNMKMDTNTGLLTPMEGIDDTTSW